MLQLHPDQLGAVRITLGPAGLSVAIGPAALADGPSVGPSVHIEASRPETLALLQHDQGALHQALTQAGIATTDRVLSFSLATNTPGGTGSGGSSGGFLPPRGGGQANGDAASAEPDLAIPRLPAPPGWQRLGLNITA